MTMIMMTVITALCSLLNKVCGTRIFDNLLYSITIQQRRASAYHIYKAHRKMASRQKQSHDDYEDDAYKKRCC